MEKMIDLTDLLKHELLDLYSAEEQIIEALPAMMEKATNPELKSALEQHLKITEEQKNRLDQVRELMMNTGGDEEQGDEKKSFSSRFFGGEEEKKCIGTEGLIKEGEKMMSEDMNVEVMDAAIIACAQKIEHYEICGYGTARAYGRELNLEEVTKLLEQTLNEEYEADDRLTRLAVGRLNIEAEQAGENTNGQNRNINRGYSVVKKDSKQPGKKSAPPKSASKGSNKHAVKKAAPAKSTAPKKSATKGSNTKQNARKASNKNAPSKAVKSAKKVKASQSSNTKR